MRRLGWLAIAAMACGTWSHAEHRSENRYDLIAGFPSASIFSLTQDRDGFIWVGVDGGGLARFDGREFRRWAPETLTTHVLFARGAGDELTLVVEPEPGASGGNTLRHIDGESVKAVNGPGGGPWTDVRDAAYDQHHRLWVARTSDLFYRAEGGEWIPVITPLMSGQRIRRLSPNRNAGVFIATTAGVFSADGNGHLTRLVETSSAADAIDRGDGSVFYVEKRPLGGGIFELRDGRATEVAFRLANFISFVQRGRSVWAAFDNGMIALRPGERPESLGPAQGVPGGGGLVDAEGSFWVATSSGLVKISEPETAVWNERDGLPVASSRYLAATAEGLWVSTWGGLARLSRAGGRWTVAAEPPLDHKWPLVTDGRGRLWGKEGGNFIERVAERFKRYAVPEAGILLSAARARDGTLWLGTEGGLFKTRPADVAPVSLARPPDVERVEQVFEDSRGELWLTSGNRLFHAPARAVVSEPRPEWSRSEISGARQFSRIIETTNGHLWVANPAGGVWRLRAGRWEPIAAARLMVPQTIHNLVPSRAGGTWVLSTGTAIRVIDRPESEAGWEAVEAINGWHGLPPTNISDLVEEPDGTLWIATGAGVVRIRLDARTAQPSPPRVSHTAFMLNGRLLNDAAAKVGPDGSQVELHFAALSYRSPASLRYQYRLRANGPWIDSTSPDAVFRFVGLGAGRYAAEVRASLDGTAWSATPARVDFEVLGPWYLRWWAIGGLLLVALSALAILHWARVAMIVRLEQQRTRIARDLHDELGSGLGSIGIMAGVAAGSQIDETARKTTAATIADTAQDLSRGLSDLVWSLSARAVSLGALAAHVADAGARMFPGPWPGFVTRFPNVWPDGDLVPLVRRNVTLIALEALRNAARHAQAARVWVSLEAASPAEWVLEVGDDGRGLGRAATDVEPGPDAGHGRHNMSARAAELRATLEWRDAPGGGTIVRLRFRPFPPRRPLAFLRGRLAE